MAELQVIRKNIDTTKNLSTVVSTMKAHASSNINQFKNAATASGEYRKVLDMSLFVIFNGEEDVLPVEEVKEGNILHIVFGSDYGLAGRFNERIASFALDKISMRDEDKIIVIGQQIFQRLKESLRIHETFSQPQTTDNISSMVNRILLQIDDIRKATPIKKIILYYNKPNDKSIFIEDTELLFPINLYKIAKNTTRWDSRSIPAYFVEKQKIISDLIRQYFFITLYRAFCFSLASENASRLASMQSAEKNIDTRLEELNFLFRRERQNNITEELNDLISGFKAIRESK